MTADVATIITAITGLVSALAGAGLFERRRRKRKRARAAAAASEHASKIAAVGRPPISAMRKPRDDGDDG